MVSSRLALYRNRLCAVTLVALSFACPEAFGASVLFDATRHPMAGNADWVIDADAWNLNLPAYPCSGSTNESNPARFPTPAQSGIGPTTPESYWTGGISAWAVDLVKAGHTVETLPSGAAITFLDGSNPQDLSQYQLFIVVEPQNPFSAAEKSAILAFVAAGGGLFMVADHETSDRDCDGWDSPRIWNDLTGAVSAASAGVFGIWFRVNGIDDSGSEDWFTDAVNANVATDPADPIIYGPHGSGAGGLGLFGSTSMDLNPADNPTVKGHVWRTGQAHGNLRVTFATASYGAGRVAAVGDSSPADDDTGDPSDNLYPGWDRASGGVNNREIHLNASTWLLNPTPDTTPPAITSGPTATAADCTAIVTWTTDEGATSLVDYGPTAGYGLSASTPGFTQGHEVQLTSLSPATEYHYRVASMDFVGNGPTHSDDAVFTTTAAADPLITAAPSVAGVTGTTVTVFWTTDEPTSSAIEFGTTPSLGDVATGSGGTTDHGVTLTGLEPTTLYYFRVAAIDSCGNGPTHSAIDSFTTTAASIDLSGWRLVQYNSAQTWVFPAGTLLPSGGYLVVGRNATREQFEAFHPGMPPATVYLNSNATGACSPAGCLPQVNGGESFELYDDANTLRDGVTVTMTSTHASYQRWNPGDPAANAGSWQILGEGAANPGQGAGTSTGSGVRINEMADAADFTKEFVEIYYDAAPTAPDTIPPAAIADLRATPLNADSLRLEWTAVGDDGQVGTATSYDIRRAAQRILSEADFAAAFPLVGVPLPAAAGAPQQFVASGLSADTAYYFAMRVADDAANVSPLSNCTAAVTAPPGSTPTAPHLVISQLRIAGSNDDAIELYNPTTAPISLADHSIQYLAANGNFGFRVNLTAAHSVPSRGWYLVAADGYSGSPTRDGSLSTSNLSASAGHALLVAKTTNVSGCADATIVDRVGYGIAASCPETSPATTPGAGLSSSRRPGGEAGAGQDSDDNAVDFHSPATPLLHNRFSPPASPPGSLGHVRDTLYLTNEGGTTRLEWAAAAGATAYRVYRFDTPDGGVSPPPPWLTTTEPRALEPATPPSIWFYIVRATDGVDETH